MGQQTQMIIQWNVGVPTLLWRAPRRPSVSWNVTRKVCNCTFVWRDAPLALQGDVATGKLLFEMLRFIYLFNYLFRFRSVEHLHFVSRHVVEIRRAMWYYYLSCVNLICQNITVKQSVSLETCAVWSEIQNSLWNDLNSLKFTERLVRSS